MNTDPEPLPSIHDIVEPVGAPLALSISELLIIVTVLLLSLFALSQWRTRKRKAPELQERFQTELLHLLKRFLG